MSTQADLDTGTLVDRFTLKALVESCLVVQERLTSQIAEMIQTKLNPLGVGVVIEARHLCMEMRGAQSKNSPTVTSAMLGAFRKDPRTREEFLGLIHGSRR